MINKLPDTHVHLHPASVYKIHGYSLQDLLCNFYKYINECIEQVNKNEEHILNQNNIMTKFIEYMKNEGIPPIVVETINNMYNDGRLKDIIDRLLNGLISQDEEFKNNMNSLMSELQNKINLINGEVDKKIEQLMPKNEVNIIYVDSINGNDENDGSENKPFQTSEKAFNYLCNLGSKTLNKQWKLKFKKGVYRSVKVDKLPQFSYPLVIEGTLEGKNIVSRFVYEELTTNYIGIWLEPLKGNAIYVKWLKFENYKKGFNGYGIIAKNQGYLNCFECEAINCDCGFAGVNNVTLTCQRTIARNCREGFRNLYNGCATIGAGTGGSHMSDGGNGCEVYDCEIGFLTSRNSVSHSDYVKYENCDIGVQIEMNSRVATLSNVFDNCKVGVNSNGGGEWIGGIGEEIDTWINLGTNIPYDLYGNSRYTRVQSLYGKLNSSFMRKIGDEITKSSLTGVTEQTELFRSSPTIESIPEYYLQRNRVKVKLIVKGTYTLSSGQSITLSPILRGLNNDNSPNNKNISMHNIKITTESTGASGFKAIFELDFNAKNYLRYTELLVTNTTGGNRVTVLPFVVESKDNREGKKQLILNATLSDASSQLNVLSIELELSN